MHRCAQVPSTHNTWKSAIGEFRLIELWCTFNWFRPTCSCDTHINNSRNFGDIEIDLVSFFLLFLSSPHRLLRLSVCRPFVFLPLMTKIFASLFSPFSDNHFPFCSHFARITHGLTGAHRSRSESLMFKKWITNKFDLHCHYHPMKLAINATISKRGWTRAQNRYWNKEKKKRN